MLQNWVSSSPSFVEQYVCLSWQSCGRFGTGMILGDIWNAISDRARVPWSTLEWQLLRATSCLQSQHGQLRKPLTFQRQTAVCRVAPWKLNSDFYFIPFKTLKTLNDPWICKCLLSMLLLLPAEQMLLSVKLLFGIWRGSSVQLFFGLLALTMLGVKYKSDKRDQYLQHGGWFVKIALWIICNIVPFLFPAGFINSYGAFLISALYRSSRSLLWRFLALSILLSALICSASCKDTPVFL